MKDRQTLQQKNTGETFGSVPAAVPPEGSGREDCFSARSLSAGARVLVIKELEQVFPVRAFFTTREGGCSRGMQESLNMGYQTPDDPENVTKNRNAVFQSLCKDAAVVVPQQVHRDRVAVIRKESLSGEEGDSILHFPETDASVTDVPQVLLTSLHADCIPVWLYDPVHHAAGLAHAGWRGTHADIAGKTAEQMQNAFGSEMKDLIAVIGPGIGMEAFEVGAEVRDAFERQIGPLGDLCRDDGNGKYRLDLKGINKTLLEARNISTIRVSGHCTFQEETLFYSYRRDGSGTGRMCAGICLL